MGVLDVVVTGGKHSQLLVLGLSLEFEKIVHGYLKLCKIKINFKNQFSNCFQKNHSYCIIDFTPINHKHKKVSGFICLPVYKRMSKNIFLALVIILALEDNLAQECKYILSELKIVCFCTPQHR